MATPKPKSNVTLNTIPSRRRNGGTKDPQRMKNHGRGRGRPFQKPYPKPEDLKAPQTRTGPKAISLHQPYASLLAHGVMRGEGRHWPCAYRGKLWICSTGRQVSESEIKRLEKKFTDNYKRLGYEVPELPTEYPISAIVGRVNLTDVLSKEEASNKIKEGILEPYYAACGAKHVFICRDFEAVSSEDHEPVRGRPKIYNIPYRMANAAQRNLTRIKEPKRNFVPAEFPVLHVVTMDNLLGSPNGPRGRGGKPQNPSDYRSQWQKSIVRDNDYDFEPVPLMPPQLMSWSFDPNMNMALANQYAANMYNAQYVVAPQNCARPNTTTPNTTTTTTTTPTMQHVPDTGLDLLRQSLEAYSLKKSKAGSEAANRFESQYRESVADAMRRKFTSAMADDLHKNHIQEAVPEKMPVAPLAV